MEVKYKEKIKKEDLKWLEFFEKKFKLDKKIVISKNFSWKIWDVEVFSFWELNKLKNNLG